MRSFKGTRRTSIAILATLTLMPLPTGATLPSSPDDLSHPPRSTPLRDLSLTTVKGPYNRCIADDPSYHWHLLRFVLEPIASDGPPELREAIAALNRDDRDLALQLLDRASFNYPLNIASRDRLAPSFQKAILSAHVIAWQLRGCPLTRTARQPCFGSRGKAMRVKGIQRAFLTIPLLVFGSSVSHAAASPACPEFTQPENWRAPLVIIDHAAKDGPPEIAQAATALRAGRREDAVALLTQAGNTSTEDALQHGRAYSYAVLDAQENAWLLNGCL